MKNNIRFVAVFGLIIAMSSPVLGFLNNPDKESPEYQNCLKWKEVCYTKTYCIQREALRSGSYRCVKPGRYGFHIYPRELEHNTNNPDTADYLQTMGYRCYHSYASSPCLQSRNQEFCDSKCVKYRKTVPARSEE